MGLRDVRVPEARRYGDCEQLYTNGVTHYRVTPNYLYKKGESRGPLAVHIHTHPNGHGRTPLTAPLRVLRPFGGARA